MNNEKDITNKELEAAGFMLKTAYLTYLDTGEKRPLHKYFALQIGDIEQDLSSGLGPLELRFGQPPACNGLSFHLVLPDGGCVFLDFNNAGEAAQWAKRIENWQSPY